ncbi:MAG: hypothetical protein L6R28_21320 [Planctomycetes bacterium]|nr:hypothetical protein [Planctomycetota bacterium]
MKPYIATTLLLALTALPASARQKKEKRERPREHHEERCDHENRHHGFDGGFIFAHSFPSSPAPEAPMYIPEANPGPDRISVNGTVYEIDGGNNVALVSKAPEPAPPPEPAQPRMTRQQHIDKMRHQAAQWRELAERARKWAKEASSPEDRKMWEDTAEHEEEQARHLDEQIEKEKEWEARDRARDAAAQPSSAPSVAMANPGPASGTGLPPNAGTPPSTGTRMPPNNGTSTPPNTGTTTPPNTGTSTPPNTGTTTPPNTGTSTPPNMGTTTPPNTGTNGGTPPSAPTRTPPARESQGEWNKDMAAEVATTALGTQMTGSEGIGGAQAAGAALTVAYQQKVTDDRNVPRTDRTNREIRDTLDHGHYSELRGEPRNVWVQTIINLLTGNW